MNLISKLIAFILILILFSCEEKENIVDADDSSDQEYELVYKDYTLDSLSGNVTHSEISIEDFNSASQCMGCHTQQYDEWSNSFHAHSFDDPIFMSIWNSEKNHRPETGVMYCIQCHAPAAFVTGYNLDGIQSSEDLQASALPDIIKEGVSCDICHTMVNKSPSVHTQDYVAAAAQYFFNPGEGIKYGSIEDPDSNAYHESLYLPLFNSSSSCKPCHNQFIRGMPIETTFSQWNEDPRLSMGGPSCQNCHMKKQADGHSSHYFAGVDLLFYDGVDNTSGHYQEVISLLKEAVTIDFEYVNGQTAVLDTVRIQNDSLFIPISIYNLTGHRLPSGTPFSREAWLELSVQNSQGETIYSKGIISSASDELDYYDDNLTIFTTLLYDQENLQGNIIYEASNALSYDDRTLRTLFYENKTYSISLDNQVSDEYFIKARMLFRPFKPQMLQDIHPEFLGNLPVIEMYADSLTIMAP